MQFILFTTQENKAAEASWVLFVVGSRSETLKFLLELPHLALRWFEPVIFEKCMWSGQGKECAGLYSLTSVQVVYIKWTVLEHVKDWVPPNYYVKGSKR